MNLVANKIKAIEYVIQMFKLENPNLNKMFTFANELPNTSTFEQYKEHLIKCLQKGSENGSDY